MSESEAWNTPVRETGPYAMKRFVTTLFIVSFTLVLSTCGDRNGPPVPDLPNKLATLTLGNAVSGAKADGMIRRMHGKSTGEHSSSRIGYYHPGKRDNVLYLTAFESRKQAETALAKMVDKMADTPLGFTPPTPDTIGGHTIHRSQGMGLSHFFFRRDNLVVWWQVVPQHAETTIAALLDAEPK